MAIDNTSLLTKLQDAELFFATKLWNNLQAEEIGNSKKLYPQDVLDLIFLTIDSLRYRVNRGIYDDTSDSLYNTLVRLIPFNLNGASIDPDYQFDSLGPVYIDALSTTLYFKENSLIGNGILAVPYYPNAGNGLTPGTTDGIVLGGSLDQATTIDINTQSLTLSGTDGSGNEISLGLSGGSFNAATISGSSANGSVYISTITGYPYGWGIQYSNSGQSVSIITQSNTNGINITDSISNVGLLYNADYSANNTTNPRWIPDKAYVDSKSTSYSFSNGLTNTSGTVGLGGTITSNTNILLNSNQLIIGNNVSGNGATHQILGGSFPIIQSTVNQVIGGTNYYQSKVSVSGNAAYIGTTNTTGAQSVYLNLNSSTGAVFGDSFFNAGLKYSADYSANFTDRSLIDKGYADSHYGTGSGSVTSVSVVTANGFSGTVATATSTPAITLTLQNATTSQSGQLTSTDWNTFNNKQPALSGTGFVKISGTTVSYDNSTYLTTASAASTYVSLSGSYSNPSWLTGVPYSILTGTVPTWNQNTTGTAANITATSNSTITTLSALSLPYSQLTGTPSLSGYQLISNLQSSVVASTTQYPSGTAVINYVTGLGYITSAGTAANISATSNSTLVTLSALSLPYSQLSGTVPTWNQNTTGTASNLSGTPALPNGTTATTQATSDNSTKLATTAFVQNVATADTVYFSTSVFSGAGTSGSPITIATGGITGTMLATSYVPYTGATTNVTIGSYSMTAGEYIIGTLGYTDTGILGSYQSSIAGYNQIILENTNTGSTASADFVVNNSNSTATTYYGDYGMNGSGFTGTGSFNQPNYVYLTSTSVDLAIGTTTSNAIHFVVNNGAADAMTISNAGAVTMTSTGTQLTLAYDGTHYTTFTTTSGGNLNIVPSSNITAFTGPVSFGNGNSNIYNPNSSYNNSNSSTAQYQFGGSSTVGYRTVFYGNSTGQLNANDSLGNVIFAKAPVWNAATGTHSILSNVVFEAIGTVTDAGASVGTITNAYFDSPSSYFRGVIVGGSSYTNGTYTSISLTGGTGSGAIATIVVAGGVVTSVTLTTTGSGYKTGDVLSATAASIGGTGSGFTYTITSSSYSAYFNGTTYINGQSYFNPTLTAVNNLAQGQILTPNLTSTTTGDVLIGLDITPSLTGVGGVAGLGTLTGGTSYTTGTYTSVPLTGGTGTGAIATITVSGGAVTVVTITTPGSRYVVGDTLSASAANIGGTGSGFSIPVTSLVRTVTGAPLRVNVGSIGASYGVQGSGTWGDGLILNNSTAATSTLSQSAPGIHFSSYGWNTGSSASQLFETYLISSAASGSTSPGGNIAMLFYQNGTKSGTAYTFAPSLALFSSAQLQLTHSSSGATSFTSLQLLNATASTSGTPNQWSPLWFQQGSTWNTGGTPASNSFAFGQIAEGTSSANPYATWYFQSYLGASSTPTFVNNASLTSQGQFNLSLQATSNIQAGSQAGSILNIGASTLTDATTAVSGTVTNFAVIGTGLTTLAATNTGITYTNGYGAFFTQPTNGTNVTMTNKYALGLAYDSTHLATFNISSAGLLTINATSTVTITPATTITGALTLSSTVNKVTITAPATSATLTLVTGSTLQTTGAFTLNLTTTAASTPTFPAGTGTLAYLAGTNVWTGVNTMILKNYQANATPTAVNASATLTAAQVQSSITTTSTTAVAFTMPTATLLATQVGAAQGTTIQFTIDNSASTASGAITITLGTGMTSGLNAGLTVPIGKAQTYLIYFTSATTCVMSQIL